LLFQSYHCLLSFCRSAAVEVGHGSSHLLGFYGIELKKKKKMLIKLIAHRQPRSQGLMLLLAAVGLSVSPLVAPVWGGLAVSAITVDVFV
jgi:hypothetical protein